MRDEIAGIVLTSLALVSGFIITAAAAGLWIGLALRFVWVLA